MGKLDGKVAMVTGAGRGHAEAIAGRFAKEGAAISICDIIPVKELEGKVGSEIRAEGGKVLCFQIDVSKEDEVNKMVKETIKNFGTVDILANVVGIAGPTKDVWDMTLAEWKRTLDVNLDSLFLCCKAVLPEMIRKRYGKIINFSSGTGKQPLSHRIPYATSKMGVIGFTRSLAADVGRYNINVNAISLASMNVNNARSSIKDGGSRIGLLFGGHWYVRIFTLLLSACHSGTNDHRGHTVVYPFNIFLSICVIPTSPIFRTPEKGCGVVVKCPKN